MKGQMCNSVASLRRRWEAVSGFREQGQHAVSTQERHHGRCCVQEALSSGSCPCVPRPVSPSFMTAACLLSVPLFAYVIGLDNTCLLVSKIYGGLKEVVIVRS